MERKVGFVRSKPPVGGDYRYTTSEPFCAPPRGANPVSEIRASAGFPPRSAAPGCDMWGLTSDNYHCR